MNGIKCMILGACALSAAACGQEQAQTDGFYTLKNKSGMEVVEAVQPQGGETFLRPPGQEKFQGGEHATPYNKNHLRGPP